MAKDASTSLATISLGSIVFACVASLALSLWWLQASVNGEHQQALVQHKADALQTRINREQSLIVRQIQSLARHPGVIDAVLGGDAAAKSAEESHLEEIIAHAMEVRLFGIGEAKAGDSSTLPFSFTSLDLVNRAEAGAPVYPEAIQTDDGWVLTVAAPLSRPDEDAIQGTLFVYLAMTIFREGLGDHFEGKVSLIQSFNNAPVHEIFTAGSTSHDGPPVSRELDNPNWNIQFVPSTKVAAARLGNLTIFIAPVLVFLIVALAGVYVGIRRARKAIVADTTRLSHQITDVINGEFKPSADYQFTAFVDVDANLARLGKKPKPEVEPVKSATPKAQPKREEMVDIEMIDEETFEQELAGQKAPEEDGAPEATEADVASIFRAYDIRGIVDHTLTPDVIRKIGLAIGSEAAEQGEQTLLVGGDGRVSSPMVMETLIEGLRASGRDIINLGLVPTPLLYYATQNSETSSGVMITGSHNPADYNGFKIVFGGRTLVEHDIQRLYQRFISEDFSSGEGNLTDLDINDEYIDAVCNDVVVSRPLKIIVDCGNGISGGIAPELYGALGCDVIPLYCEVDGNFPNHHPDPTIPENLDDLILMVKSQQADVGIALDGDGDRLVAVAGSGEIIWPDKLLMLFAKDVVSHSPGSDVVYDVKCTRHINTVISGFGGRPIMCRSGHSFVKEKIAETNAVLGGELSGHICFVERWTGFDDGLYAGARLLEIIGSQEESLDELLAEFPPSVATPEILIPVAEDKKFPIVRQMVKTADFPDGTVSTVDGLRVDFSEGWGLIRASNTNPALTLRFEADNDSNLQKIKQQFREKLQAVDNSLDF